MEYATITYRTIYVPIEPRPSLGPGDEAEASAAILRHFEEARDDLWHMALDPLGRTRRQAEGDRAIMRHLARRWLCITLRKIAATRA